MPEIRAAVDVRSATVVKQLVIERTLKSSPERVFDAFTDPDQLTKWWWPTGFACPAAEVDLRVEVSTGSRWNGRARSLPRPSSPTTWVVSITRSIVRVVLS